MVLAEPQYGGTLAFMILALIMFLGCSSLRFYAIRDKRRTMAFLVSDILYMFFIVTCLISWSVGMRQIEEGQGFVRQGMAPILRMLMIFSETNMILYYSLSAAFNLELWTLKFAFLALFCGFWARLEKLMKCLLSVLMFATLATGVFNIAAYLDWCHPISANYAVGNQRPAGCIPASVNPTLITVQFITNFLTSVAIFSFPFCILRSLNLERKERFGLFFIFFCGFITLATSAVRFGIMRALVGNESARITYVKYQQILCITEVIIANLAFCLPSYRALVKGRSLKQLLGINHLSSSGARFLDAAAQAKASLTRSRNDNEEGTEDGSKQGVFEISVTRELQIDVEYNPELAALGFVGLMGYDSNKLYKAKAYANRKSRRRSSTKEHRERVVDEEPALLAQPGEIALSQFRR